MDWVRQRLIRVHPKSIQFRRFLRSLPLDPELLPERMPDLAPTDFIVCGCPRTGTSLLGAVLFQPPSLITVIEPWDGMRLPPHELFASLRHELQDTRQLSRGTLDYDALVSQGKVRRVPEGSRPARMDLADTFHLGVKWPAYYDFIRRMPGTKFVVCLRHPLEVIASFKAIGGSVAEGFDYDTAFNRRMNETLKAMTADPALRRIYLFDYIHARLLPLLELPNVHVVRYERWGTDPEGQRRGLSKFLGVEVGAGPVSFDATSKTGGLTAAEIEFVRRECRTASRLGYSLDP